MVDSLQVDVSAPVMVSGATGYVAGWIVKALLEAGCTVHAPVRDPTASDKLRHLQAIAAQAPGRLRWFQADLLQPGSYAEAMAGCATVLHTASPFTTRIRDPQKELVEPALLGTRNVLQQATATASVKRVVVTSSCAAIYSDAIDAVNAPGGRLSEAQWNARSSLTYQPYSYSKTVAEREAWTLAEAEAQWRLVVVNPSLVIGPALQPRPTSESFSIVRQMGDGRMRFGAPRLGLGAVDVRDLAEAHLAAAFSPTAAGRYIVSAHDTDLLAMARCLLDKYGARYPIPRRALPKPLFWLLAPIASGLSRQFVSLNVDIPWRADNRRGIAELGLRYRPLQASMEEMFEQMIDSGQLPRR